MRNVGLRVLESGSNGYKWGLGIWGSGSKFIRAVSPNYVGFRALEYGPWGL